MTDQRVLAEGYALNDYRIERVLGQGGFGITYLATDKSLDRKVAIKEYFPREFAARDSTRTVHAAGNQDDKDNFKWGMDRFIDEAKTLARFNHPNIIAVRRFFQANGTAYLVMDYCDGEPLDALLKRQGPLSPERLDRILWPLLDGLEQVHGMGVMHRDIKPGNLFIRADGSPVLLDFGAAREAIASHSRSVTSLATEGYAPFEQYSTRGQQGPWSDIYAMAATLYRAVTGEKPPSAPDRMLEDSLVPVATKVGGEYPLSILKAIDAGLAVRPAQRPQSIAEWREMFNHQTSTPTPQQGHMTQDNSTGHADRIPVVKERPAPVFLNAIVVALFVVSAIVSVIRVLSEPVAEVDVPQEATTESISDANAEQNAMAEISKEIEAENIKTPLEFTNGLRADKVFLRGRDAIFEYTFTGLGRGESLQGDEAQEFRDSLVPSTCQMVFNNPTWRIVRVVYRYRNNAGEDVLTHSVSYSDCN